MSGLTSNALGSGITRAEVSVDDSKAAAFERPRMAVASLYDLAMKSDKILESGCVHMLTSGERLMVACSS